MTKVRWICLSMYLAQMTISLILFPLFHKTDLFPFFNWSLFSFFPTVQEKIYINVTELDGVEQKPSLRVFEHRDLFPGAIPSSLPHQIISFGWAFINNGPENEKTRIYRAGLERSLFFNYRSAKYELVIGQVNLREFVFDHKIKDIKVISSLSYEKVQ